MRRALLLSLTALVATGCSSSRVSRGQAASVSAQLSVERFLQASNARDLEAMSRLFGTKDGPIGDTGSSFGCFWKKIGSIFGGSSCRKWRDVEVQMDVLSQVLQHEDYRFGSEQRVAGRDAETTRLGVDMTVRGRLVRDVGFTVVRSGAGRWMVQEIEILKLTNTR